MVRAFPSSVSGHNTASGRNAAGRGTNERSAFHGGALAGPWRPCHALSPLPSPERRSRTVYRHNRPYRPCDREVTSNDQFRCTRDA